MDPPRALFNGLIHSLVSSNPSISSIVYSRMSYTPDFFDSITSDDQIFVANETEFAKSKKFDIQSWGNIVTRVRNEYIHIQQQHLQQLQLQQQYQQQQQLQQYQQYQQQQQLQQYQQQQQLQQYQQQQQLQLQQQQQQQQQHQQQQQQEQLQQYQQQQQLQQQQLQQQQQSEQLQSFPPFPKKSGDKLYGYAKYNKLIILLYSDKQYIDWAASCLGITPEDAIKLFQNIFNRAITEYNDFMQHIQVEGYDTNLLYGKLNNIRTKYSIPEETWKRFFIYVRDEIIHNETVVIGGKKSRYKKRTRAIKYRHKKSVKVYRNRQRRSRQQRRLRS